MTGFHDKDGVLHADGHALTAIAQEFGTPAYVYSGSVIRAQYETLAGALKDAIPKDRQPLLCYACKANSNIAVLNLLRGMGAGLEIVSEGELHRGIKTGFDPRTIVSTGVGKQVSEIKECLKAGIHQFNVESLPELHQIADIAQSMSMTATVVFRLNPDVSGGGHHKISTGRKRDKFGLSLARTLEGYQYAQDHPHLDAVGLSMHIGSQVFTVNSFKDAFRAMAAAVSTIRSEGYTVSRLDIGGGFPINYKDEGKLDLNAYARWVNDLIVPMDTEIVMEPGRYMVGNAGVLLTRTLYVKETSDRRFLVLDGAMNDLIRPTLYDAYHEIDVVENRSRKKKTYDVVGPICETGDTFTHDRNLPTIHAGELAIIKSAGAYGFCMASNYNTRPMPPEILVDGDNIAVIRPRQSYADIIDLEEIPSWL